MLAYDFFRTQKEKYDIILVDKTECDITSFESVMQCIATYEPDVVLNCAAYTAVDDAEDIGMKSCFDVNTLGVKNIAKATSIFDIACITISTDYVFDGQKSDGYLPTDMCHPINAYGVSKYLGERLALDENPRTIIVRTSWLYGWKSFTECQNNRAIESTETCKPVNLWNCTSDGIFKNFVNTMLRLSDSKTELKVVSDQHGIPTSCIDLSFALARIIDDIESREYAGRIFHLSNSIQIDSPVDSDKNQISNTKNSITWADFAREIFRTIWKDISVVDCTSSEYPTKAKRPNYSILKNTSEIILDDWRDGLHRYLKK